MQLRSVLLGLALAVQASLVACAAAPAQEEEQGANAALSGSLTDARFCALRDAYLAGSFADFTPQDVSQLPTAAQSTLKNAALVPFSAVYSFPVIGIGTVVVAEENSETATGLATDLVFVTHTGELLGYAYVTSTSTTFSKSIRTGATTAEVPYSQLQCSHAQAAATGPLPENGDGGDASMASP